jgi:hypothetical protein
VGLGGDNYNNVDNVNANDNFNNNGRARPNRRLEGNFRIFLYVLIISFLASSLSSFEEHECCLGEHTRSTPAIYSSLFQQILFRSHNQQPYRLNEHRAYAGFFFEPACNDKTLENQAAMSPPTERFCTLLDANSVSKRAKAQLFLIHTPAAYVLIDEE